MKPLPFFRPKPALEKLPAIKGLTPKELEVPHDRRSQKPHRLLINAIDLEHRIRHDVDGRTKLFSNASNEQKWIPGAILMVEYVQSRSKADRLLTFPGVLVEVRRKGIMSSIRLRAATVGTFVEMLFPIYSPMVQSIAVLKEAPESLTTPDGQQLKPGDDILWLRQSSCPEISFAEVDALALQHSAAKRSAMLRHVKNQK